MLYSHQLWGTACMKAKLKANRELRNKLHGLLLKHTLQDVQVKHTKSTLWEASSEVCKSLFLPSEETPSHIPQSPSTDEVKINIFYSAQLKKPV